MLIVEDSYEDVAVVQRIFRKIGFSRTVLHYPDGALALSMLKDGSLAPALVLLDLNLPGLDGRTFLRQLKDNEALANIPVVVFSTSDDASDVDFCYRAGASGYVVKEMDLERQTSTLRALVEYWFGAVLLPSASRPE